MKEKILDPIELDSKFIEEVDKRIVEFFRQEIYLPLFSILPDYKIENSELDLLRAIQKGTISFYRGKFTGKFNANISKELKRIGAKWKGSSFQIPYARLSDDIKLTIKTAEASWLKTTSLVEKKLNKILSEDIASKLNFKGIIDRALFSLEADFSDQIKGITIPIELTPKNVKDISENYTNNMQYYIQDFTEKEIVKLRKKVRENVVTGARYEGLAKRIKESYGVSNSKALFLARQETNLLVAKFTESRYTDLGWDEYIWETVIGSPNHPVREGHARLKGKRCSFKNPPVVNKKGDRKNPKEDFGCRCRARVVARF